MTEKTTGLVLSGGGSRGAMHLGVLKALDEMGIRPSAISGVSAGSICGAFYFAGYSPEETIKLIQKNGFLKWARLSWNRKGLFDTDKLIKLFSQYLPEDFSLLKGKLFITATDIKRGESITYSSGPLVPAMVGSMCLPVLFKPVEHENRMLLDGGILNNFAVEPLEGETEIIIGAHSNHLSDEVEKPGIRDIIDRCLHLAIGGTVYPKVSRCHFFLDPPEMAAYGFLDSSCVDKVFDLGYQAAMKNRSVIEKLYQ